MDASQLIVLGIIALGALAYAGLTKWRKEKARAQAGESDLLLKRTLAKQHKRQRPMRPH